MRITFTIPHPKRNQARSQPSTEPKLGSDISRTPHKDSRIWQNAIQRYYEELRKGSYNGHAIDKDLWNIKNPVELLDQIKSLPSLGRWIDDLKILERILLSLSDFAAVTALVLGMNGRVAAVIWGFYPFTPNLAQPDFPGVVQMLKDLETTLPKYKNYEQQLPMIPKLQDANNPIFARSANIWSHFNRGFLKTISNIKDHSRRVDEEVDIIRMTCEADSGETIKVLGIEEIGTTSKAFEYLEKAKSIHLANNPNHMSRTSAIYAMTYLGANQSVQALEALRHCWKLQRLSEQEVAVSQYPKHSGDIILLARIYYALDDTEAALQLASKTITIRKSILGNKGPRVADSMFFVACILRKRGKESLATKLLREIIDMSQGMVEMQSHLARALWTLGTIEEINSGLSEAEQLKQNAKAVRRKIEGAEGGDEDTKESFSKLVGYMLW